ncbi:MAG: sodium-translocating pyrophosphatase, partial [Syntrophomonadaceae bacterium]|nr:sodium-translocating pyrophosphatase [Syntrophomonadaceae bacterium]
MITLVFDLFSPLAGPKIKNVIKSLFLLVFSLAATLFLPLQASASEANLTLPALESGQHNLLLAGIVVCILGMIFGYYQFYKIKKLHAHKSMLDVAQVIYET